MILSVFLLKVFAGIMVGYVYTHYYSDRSTADVFKYFDDSKVMFDSLHKHPADYVQMLFGIYNDNKHFHQYYNQMHNWYRQYESNLYNDSHTIIRFNAFIRIFSMGYYNVHTVFMCFLSFVGLVGIFKTFSTYFTKNWGLLFSVIFLVPSVLFWGSGVLKEGLLLFALGMLLYSLKKVSEHKITFWPFVWIASSFILLMYLKFYILIALFPSIAIYLLVTKTGNKQVLLKYFSVIGMFILFEIITSLLFPQYNALKILAMKQRDFIGLSNFMNSKSYFPIHKLEPTIWSLVSNIPHALYNTMLRPTFSTFDSGFKILTAIENAGIMLLILISFLFIKKKSEIHYPMALFTLTFVLVLFTVIGLVTPVTGAIVRYKVPGIPFLLIFCLLIIDMDKVETSWKKLKQKMSKH